MDYGASTDYFCEINMLKRLKVIYFCIFCTALLVGCTTDIELENLPSITNQIVVEGTIETNSPPIVFLTKNFPYYGNYNLNDLSSYFVRGASVKVTSSEGDQAILQEYCIRDYISFLSAEQKVNLYRLFGFNYSVDSLEKYKDSVNLLPNICFYSTDDIFSYYATGIGKFIGKPKTEYILDIKKDTQQLTASTVIPATIKPLGLYYKPHPNTLNDSLVTVYVQLSVPDTFGNFVRYWTRRNQQPYYLPRSRSVWDDKLWVGSNIALPVERGQSRGTKRDETYTYFWKGDSVVLKWANIDKKTYDFWSTLERDNGDNPFSTPIAVKTNINGGLGIWAGYNISTLSINIPK